jgi:hypothetical protein
VRVGEISIPFPLSPYPISHNHRLVPGFLGLDVPGDLLENNFKIFVLRLKQGALALDTNNDVAPTTTR